MILTTRWNPLYCWLQKILWVSYIQGYDNRSSYSCRNLLPICVLASELKVNFFTSSHNTKKTMAAGCPYCHEMLHEQPNTGTMLCLPSTVKFSCSLTDITTIFQTSNNFLQRNWQESSFLLYQRIDSDFPCITTTNSDELSKLFLR